jgi:chloride channel 7
MYRNTEHDCFPIVDVDSGGVLVGTILRKCLTVLLKHKAFEQQQHHYNNKSLYNSSTSSAASHSNSSSAIPLVNWSQLENIYPRYPSIDSVVLSADDRKCWIDLRPYVNTAPYVINGTYYKPAHICSLVVIDDFVNVR